MSKVCNLGKTTPRPSCVTVQRRKTLWNAVTFAVTQSVDYLVSTYYQTSKLITQIDLFFDFLFWVPVHNSILWQSGFYFQSFGHLAVVRTKLIPEVWQSCEVKRSLRGQQMSIQIIIHRSFEDKRWMVKLSAKQTDYMIYGTCCRCEHSQSSCDRLLVPVLLYSLSVLFPE